MQKQRYIQPRPWTARKLPHLSTGMMAIIDAEGQTIAVVGEDTAIFMVGLENCNFITTPKVKEGCITSLGNNVFRVFRYTQRHRRFSDIGRQPKG